MDFKDFATGEANPQPRPESWWARMDVTIDDFVEVAQIALLVICLITMVCGLIALLIVLPMAFSQACPSVPSWSKAVHFIA